MPNSSASMAQQISLFRTRIQNRSFDDVTLRILESILASGDARSLNGVESALKQMMRDESLIVLGEIAMEAVEIKLLCVDFLVRVFAVIGDVESCLVLRYEALVMRKEKATTHPGLQVSSKEWLNFVESSVENGFHSIARHACEKAIMSCGTNCVARAKMDDILHDGHVIKKIRRLKDVAQLAISSQSVEAQALMHLKQKEDEKSTLQVAPILEAKSSGSSRFRTGIMKHNLRKFHAYRCS
ncbi:Unknown protein [Striga hermonthica]|uniref:Uncharacterized protein n=1 Tax=Striga hermonthica TaxID=68872 RepID=A0A9N7MWH6_STRHE|nr:Unknown protein [Striga hermonthica]